jgi:hypothetical protein
VTSDIVRSGTQDRRSKDHQPQRTRGLTRALAAPRGSFRPVTSDIVRGGTEDRRSYRNLGLVQLAILSLLALAVAVDDSDSYDSRLVVPGLIGVGLLVLWSWWWAIPRVSSSWRAEIGPDTIRWRGGWRRRDRVIRRADVAAARSGGGRFLQLGFYDASGKRVGTLPLFHFPPGRTAAALRRHGWPVPTLRDLVDS